jgi:hypothetical protein
MSVGSRRNSLSDSLGKTEDLDAHQTSAASNQILSQQESIPIRSGAQKPAIPEGPGRKTIPSEPESKYSWLKWSENSARDKAQKTLRLGGYTSAHTKAIAEIVSAPGARSEFVQAAEYIVLLEGKKMIESYGSEFLSSESIIDEAISPMKCGIALISDGSENVMHEELEESWRRMTPDEIKAIMPKNYVGKDYFRNAVSTHINLCESYHKTGKILENKCNSEYNMQLAQKCFAERNRIAIPLKEIGEKSTDQNVRQSCNSLLKNCGL